MPGSPLTNQFRPAATPKPGPRDVRRGTSPATQPPTPRPNLVVVPQPPAPPRRNLLEPRDPKLQTRDHPRGCRCNYHRPDNPFTIPRTRPDVVPLLAGRRLILVDVENFQGTPNVSAHLVAEDFRFAKELLSITRDDLVVFGMSHYAARRCSYVLPLHQSALVLGSGPDGADRALISAARLDRLALHYSALVVISNDHIFTDLARSAAGLGMVTWNVSTDLAEIAPFTRSAYHGWTHLKLSAVRTARQQVLNDRARNRAASAVGGLTTASTTTERR